MTGVSEWEKGAYTGCPSQQSCFHFTYSVTEWNCSIWNCLSTTGTKICLEKWDHILSVSNEPLLYNTFLLRTELFFISFLWVPVWGYTSVVSIFHCRSTGWALLWTSKFHHATRLCGFVLCLRHIQNHLALQWQVVSFNSWILIIFQKLYGFLWINEIDKIFIVKGQGLDSIINL